MFPFQAGATTWAWTMKFRLCPKDERTRDVMASMPQVPRAHELVWVEGKTWFVKDVEWYVNDREVMVILHSLDRWR